MSKYFDEVYRANNGAAGVRSTSMPPPQALPEEKMLVPGSVITLPLERTENAVPVSETLRFQFAEEDALGVFQESYRALRTRLLRLRADKGLRSVAVTSAAKGEGKTLTSLNLAYSCAQLGDLKILLIDADIRAWGLSRMLHAPRGPGVSDILIEKTEPERTFLPTDLPNLYFMSAGTESGAPAELLAGQRWLQMMQWCAETFSLVIVDTPPILNFTDVELITAGCDGTVLVVRSQQTLVQQLQESARQIDSKKLVGVVLNAARGRSEVYKYGYAVAAKK